MDVSGGAPKQKKWKQQQRRRGHYPPAQPKIDELPSVATWVFTQLRWYFRKGTHPNSIFMESFSPPKKMGDPSYTKAKAKQHTHKRCDMDFIYSNKLSYPLHLRLPAIPLRSAQRKPMRVADWKKKKRVVMFFFTKYLLLKSYISKEPKMKKKHANEIEKWIVAIVDLLVLVLVFCFITFSGKNLGNCMFFFEISGVFPWWHRNPGEFGAAEFSHEHPIKWVTKWPKRWASQPHRFPWIFLGGVPWDPYKFATFWGEKVMWGRYDLSRYMCMYYIYIYIYL